MPPALAARRHALASCPSDDHRQHVQAWRAETWRPPSVLMGDRRGGSHSNSLRQSTDASAYKQNCTRPQKKSLVQGTNRRYWVCSLSHFDCSGRYDAVRDQIRNGLEHFQARWISCTRLVPS
jgi:hypothetical protein